MTTLKELTWEKHKDAESTAFVKKMLKKELTEYQYYVHLSNQASMYWFLEKYASENELFKGVEELKRCENMLMDLKNIEKQYGFKHPLNTPSTEMYISHLRKIKSDREKLLAHMYVRYMGDLYGGQILKNLIPVPYKTHYDFEGNIEELKSKFRSKIHIGLANEANLCFDFIINVLNDLEKDLDL